MPATTAMFWRPACAASSPSATCAPNRSSASPRRSAKARRSSRRCTRFLAARSRRSDHGAESCGDQFSGASSKPLKSKPGATVQPHERPVAERLRRLPGVSRHDRLRPFAAGKIGSRALCARCGRAPARSQAQAARRHTNARPRPHRRGANANARRGRAENRSRSKRRGRRFAARRERSRGNARLPDAA